MSKQPGVTFDLMFMTVQAAIDGIGVAMGRTSYVQDDIGKGRLWFPSRSPCRPMPDSIWFRLEGRDRFAETGRFPAMADRSGQDKSKSKA